jgi:hypothetical protein
VALAGSGDILGLAIKAAVDQVAAQAVAAGSEVDRNAMFKAIGNAIIAHILLFGVAAVLGTSAPGGGPVVSTIT